MSLEQNIIDDKAAIETATAAVTAAQATLEAANKQLATDEAALAAQPTAPTQMSVLAEIEAYVIKVLGTATDEFKLLMEKARAVFGK